MNVQEQTVLNGAESFVKKFYHIIKKRVRCGVELDFAETLDYCLLFDTKNIQVRKTPIPGLYIQYCSFTSTYFQECAFKGDG